MAARHRRAILAGVFASAYLFFPTALAGTTLLAHRFLPVACMFLVAAAAPPRTLGGRRTGTRGAAAATAAILPLVTVGVSLRAYREADAAHRALDVVIAEIPRNVAVAQLDLTPNRGPRIPGAPSRVLAERGGRMLYALTDMPPNPVYVERTKRWEELILRTEHAPFAFAPSHDLRRFAYLLVMVEGRWPKYRADVATALAPEAERIVSSGEWDLYRSKLPLDALDAPDRALPDPPPSSLADRIKRVRSERASTAADGPAE
jgi:hypothetical protein